MNIDINIYWYDDNDYGDNNDFQSYHKLEWIKQYDVSLSDINTKKIKYE